MQRTALLLTVLVVAARQVDARWQGPQDSKPFSELRSMAPDELFNESFDVCIRRAMLEKSAASDPESEAEVTAASEYLELLDVATAAQHGGAAPAWMATAGRSALRQGLPAGLPHVSAERGAGTRRHATGTAAGGTARRSRTGPPVAKPARPRVGGATEELPPWLAPPANP